MTYLRQNLTEKAKLLQSDQFNLVFQLPKEVSPKFPTFFERFDR